MGFFSGNKQVDFPDFPFPLEPVSGKQAARRLEELQGQASETGTTPVLVGDAGDVRKLMELREMNRELGSPDDIIRRSMELDPGSWLAGRYQNEEHQEDMQDLMGEWPGRPKPGTEMRTQRKVLLPGYKKQVFIAQLPTPHAWQVPAHLMAGGWNEYPDPAMETAIARMWQERYGARYAACIGDTVEFLVATPPATREEAERLAWEQYNFCPDIVDQGVETIANLASTLMNGTVWFFWWD